MFMKIATIFVVLTLVLGVSFAQQTEVMRKAPIIVNEPEVTYTPTTSAVERIQLDGYILVDSMANAFGPAIGTINPFAYDPYADVVAFVHRGHSAYAQGSGELWYNISTDKGVTWTRVPTSINGANSQFLGRYPSMAISNPTQGGINATTAVFAWPELLPGATGFGWVGYGVDQPIGAGSTFSAIIEGQSTFSSQTPCWASDNSNWFYFDSDFGTAGNAAIRFFRTEDFINMEEINPPQWASTVFQDNGNIVVGGVSYNGTEYFGVIGSFVDPDPNNPINFGWYPGLSKSTDNGATWSDFEVIDPRLIPALSAFDQLYDYKPTDAFVSFSGDINVDKDGYTHFVLSLTDTNTANNAVVEIFETASGWDAKVIFDGLLDGSYEIGPGLGQMGPSEYVAIDENREFMVCQWVNGIEPELFCDIFYSYRKLDGEWSTPENITNSATINNSQSHLATRLGFDGVDTYTAFSMYGYVSGVTGPYSDTTLTTNIYASPITITLVGVGDEIIANDFNLEQNYPNPFNPSTTIKYSLAERSAVTLKVYDVLGNEVANLVNTTQEAGQHSINFDASSLSSGLYLYTLNTGNFTSSKKMMLLK